MLKSIVLFAIAVCSAGTIQAADKSLSLDVKFDSTKTIDAGGYKVNLTGPFVKTEDGGTGLAYGTKELPRIPADTIMGKDGTIIFTFMVKPRKKENLLKNRMLLAVRGKGRERIFFYQTGGREYVLFTLKKYISRHAVRSLQPVKFNRWYQAACTWDGSTVKFYLDGKLQAEFKQPYIPEYPKRSSFIHFGPYVDRCTNPKPWGEDSCIVRDLKVYKRALSMKEIMLAAGLKPVDKTMTYKSFLNIPQIKTGPVADGTLKDPAWQRAASFICLIDGSKPDESLSYKRNNPKFCHDGKNLYISFESVFPGNYKIIMGDTRKGKDSQVWANESFELYFLVGKNFYRFAGNVAGGNCEMLNLNKDFNGKWTYKRSLAVRIDDSRLWQGEIVIPFATIGVKTGDEFKINFCRTWRGLQRVGVTSLAGTSTYGDQAAFATVKLSGMDEAFRQIAVNNPNFGNLSQQVQFTAAKNTRVDYQVSLMSSGGFLPDLEMWNRLLAIKAGVIQPWSGSRTIETTSYDRILFKAVDRDSKRILMQQVVPFKILENFLDVIPAFSSAKVYMKPRYGMIRNKSGGNPVELALKAPDGKMIYKTTISSDSEFAVPFARKNPVGTYIAEIFATIKGRKQIFASKSFAYHGIGPWEKETPDGRVLAPFTPLTLKQKKGVFDIGMWGRVYDYSGSPLPSKIMALNKPVAASVNLYVNGTAVKCPVKITTSSPSRIEMSGENSAKQYDIAQNAWVEYDGFLWNDIKIKAKENLDNLKLVVDIPPQMAKFYHITSAGFGAGGRKTGVLDKTLEVPFYPFVWLGSYEQGLCWFAESNSAWKTKQKYPIKLIKQGNRAALEITFADKLRKGQKIDLQFGLLATPVKPLPPGYPMNVFGDGFSTHLNTRSGRSPINAVRISTVKSGPTFNDFPPFSMKDLAANVAMGKKNNAVTVPYQVAIYMADKYPVVKDNLLEWQAVPEAHLSYEYNGKPMRWFNVCPASEAADYYVYRVKEFIDKAGLAGLYFDFGPVNQCSNRYHGCNGGYPIRAKRRFYKMIAQALADKNNGKYYIVVHNSESVQIPVFTFVTHFFNGEGLRQMSSSVFHNGKDLLDHYTINDFASEHSSLPWGVTSSIYVPADPLLERFGGPPKTGKDLYQERYRFRMTKAAMAGALIHNTIPSSSRLHYGWFDKLIRFYDDFKVDQAEFMPYWRNMEYVKVLKGKDIYVSFYRSRDRKEILAIIAHVSKDHLDQEVEIEFDPAKLGFKRLTSAQELLTGPDPKYQELFKLVPLTRHYSPKGRGRIPIVPGDFGVKFQGLKDNKIKLNLQHHSVALVKITGE